MGNCFDLKVSRAAVLAIYELYAEKYACIAKAMSHDADLLEEGKEIPTSNIYWELVAELESKIDGKLDELRAQGKDLVAYKIRYALPLASISPSRLLKVLEVCGVQYDD